MYVKLLWHLVSEAGVSDNQGGTKDLVVPTENQMFEAIDVKWRKVRISSQEELDNFYHNTIPCYVVNDVPSKFKGKDIEILRVVLTRRDEKNEETCATIIAYDCSMFIMNNEGKTIERVIVSN